MTRNGPWPRWLSRLTSPPVQFFGGIRARWPTLHRWIGRVYAFSAIGVGIGGLGFLAVSGAIGGWPMTTGFAIYGVLIVAAAIETFRYARARRIEEHRAWATRLFALVIGSWLYRMDYGFWLLLIGHRGHTKTFDGTFDIVMDFFFYVPNLVVAEAFVRSQGRAARRGVRIGACAIFSAATTFLVLATYFFGRYEWGPAILSRF
jgi:hypothetical protein